MKINRATVLPFVSPVWLVPLALAGCVAAPVPAPPPPPAPVAPPPPPPVAAPAPTDWRDVPQTPGDWRFAPLANGSEARFGPSGGGDTLVVLRCDRGARTVTLYRAGAATGPVPASITTSSEMRPASAMPVAGASPPMVALAFAAGDRMLDAMAFSRGRFVIDVNGLPVLTLPAWAEVGRVVEDCRKGG